MSLLSHLFLLLRLAFRDVLWFQPGLRTLLSEEIIRRGNTFRSAVEEANPVRLHGHRALVRPGGA
jgi:hypothetical protein